MKNVPDARQQIHLASLHVSINEKTPENIISKAEELLDEINALTPNRTDKCTASNDSHFKTYL